MIDIFLFIARLRKAIFTKAFWTLLRIRFKKRFNVFITHIFGFPFTAIDSASFIAMYIEIFLKQIYKFKTSTNRPMIIDCGSNIGLSILFFKKEYPDSEIIAFEADPKIFQILRNNILNSGYSGIQLNNVAVWSKESKIEFKSNSADGGKLVFAGETNNHDIIVNATSIRKYLVSKIDFLKIDIEGAEYEVLKDISDLLGNVDRIFIEYHSLNEKNQNLHEILVILNGAGFRYYLEQTTVFSINPFEKINVSNEFDNLINIFGFRKSFTN